MIPLLHFIDTRLRGLLDWIGGVFFSFLLGILEFTGASRYGELSFRGLIF